MLFDVLEVRLESMLKEVNEDLAYAKKDPQYYDKETSQKVCRLRDSLSIAHDTAAELNVLAGQ